VFPDSPFFAYLIRGVFPAQFSQPRCARPSRLGKSITDLLPHRLRSFFRSPHSQLFVELFEPAKFNRPLALIPSFPPRGFFPLFLPPFTIRRFLPPPPFGVAKVFSFHGFPPLLPLSPPCLDRSYNKLLIFFVNFLSPPLISTDLRSRIKRLLSLPSPQLLFFDPFLSHRMTPPFCFFPLAALPIL